MNFQTMSNQRKYILIAAAVGFIACFLPWISISFGGYTAGSVNGLHSYGFLCFFSFIGAGAVAYMGNQTLNLEKTMWFVALACGAIALLFEIIFLSDAGGFSGFGLYIALLAAVGVLFSAWKFKSPGDDIKSGFESLKKDINEKTQSNTPPPNPPL